VKILKLNAIVQLFFGKNGRISMLWDDTSKSLSQVY
jgi:hypothetical protein